MREMSRISGRAVKSNVYMNVRESGRARTRACGSVEVTRGVHKFHTGTTLSRRCIFARLFPPPVPPPPLLPPTRRVVSHALYLEARRARIPRSYALSHRSGIAKICHARLYIRDGPQDDVSFILRDVWSAL